jgi:hypothetical protein
VQLVQRNSRAHRDFFPIPGVIPDLIGKNSRSAGENLDRWTHPRGRQLCVCNPRNRLEIGNARRTRCRVRREIRADSAQGERFAQMKTPRRALSRRPEGSGTPALAPACVQYLPVIDLRLYARYGRWRRTVGRRVDIIANSLWASREVSAASTRCQPYGIHRPALVRSSRPVSRGIKKVALFEGTLNRRCPRIGNLASTI